MRFLAKKMREYREITPENDPRYINLKLEQCFRRKTYVHPPV